MQLHQSGLHLSLLMCLLARVLLDECSSLIARPTTDAHMLAAIVSCTRRRTQRYTWMHASRWARSSGAERLFLRPPNSTPSSIVLKNEHALGVLICAMDSLRHLGMRTERVVSYPWRHVDSTILHSNRLDSSVNSAATLDVTAANCAAVNRRSQMAQMGKHIRYTA